MTANPKKHARSDDDSDEDEEEYLDMSGKRVKLLMNNLSLDDKRPLKSRRYEINPELHFFDNTTVKGYDSYTGSNLTSKLNGIIADHFQKVLHSGLQVIRWYDYRFVVIYRYKRWFVKLWNRFVKKYNQKNKVYIRAFGSMEQILKLIQDNLITWKDLTNIITQENELEIKRLELKEEIRNLDKRFEEISAENDALKDIHYNYWDNLNFDKDLDMLDVSDDELEGGKISELNDDSPMEM
ncbi:hypothetical protein Cantr_08955 [Candida viswanathii]|uniref:Uncharacterized protein n=1 Tax=Candida viswanathii TaxID=5486 RepID=A0A367Y9Y0_9ASCO|nr:hypothetical protein Cantr_08955 [Candida viswanathii]